MKSCLKGSLPLLLGHLGSYPWCQLFISYVKDCYALKSIFDWQAVFPDKSPWLTVQTLDDISLCAQDYEAVSIISREALWCQTDLSKLKIPDTLRIKAAIKAQARLTAKPCSKNMALTSGLHLWMSQVEPISHHRPQRSPLSRNVGLIFSQIVRVPTRRV